MPNYLVLNIKRCAELFENIDIELVTDMGHRQNSRLPSRIIGVGYKPTLKTNLVLGQIKRKKSFRNNFWRLSTERLISVLELVIQDNIPRLHIESDILLFRDFPFEWFSEIELSMWCKYSDERDSAALFFVPNREEATQLLKIIYEEVQMDPWHTDMTVLKTVAESKEISFEYFPSVGVGQNGLTAPDAKMSRKWELTSRHDLLPKRVIDSASIGMWLTGQDVRNNFGLLVLHENFSNFIQVTSPVDYEYELAENSNHLKIHCSGETWALVCLHIHSKNEKLFDDKNAKCLAGYVKKSRKKELLKELRFKLFVKYAISGLRDGSIARVYLVWILGKLKMIRTISNP
jgi:hypothetical protein